VSDTRRQSDKRIANVPTLDGIKDPAIRAVLEPLVQGWAVRNGQSPVTDEHRFITKADLNQWTLDGTLLNGMFKGVSLTTGQTVPGSGGTATQQAVTSIVNSAVNEVQNSEFWKFLGRRIEAVALPMTAFKLDLGKMQTAQYTETQSRYNMNTAILSSLTQLFAGIPGGPHPIWSMKTNGTELITTSIDSFARDYTDVRSSANGAIAAVQIETQTRASETGNLFGQYSVKVDLNGFVSGFGLSASANDNTAGSEFYVRADRFAVGGPTSTGTRHTGQFLEYTVNGRTYRQEVLRPPGAANIPFIVQSGGFEYRGRNVDGGVFITNAFIQNGAIGTAQIGVAQIDSLAVGGNQITVPYWNNASDTLINATFTDPTWTPLVWLNVLMPESNFRDGYVETPSGIVVNTSFWFQPGATTSTLACARERERWPRSPHQSPMGSPAWCRSLPSTPRHRKATTCTTWKRAGALLARRRTALHMRS
jgi:hypothetical protein